MSLRIIFSDGRSKIISDAITFTEDHTGITFLDSDDKPVAKYRSFEGIEPAEAVFED